MSLNTQKITIYTNPIVKVYRLLKKYIFFLDFNNKTSFIILLNFYKN